MIRDRCEEVGVIWLDKIHLGQKNTSKKELQAVHRESITDTLHDFPIHPHSCTETFDYASLFFLHHLRHIMQINDFYRNVMFVSVARKSNLNAVAGVLELRNLLEETAPNCPLSRKKWCNLLSQICGESASFKKTNRHISSTRTNWLYEVNDVFGCE